MRAEVPRLRGVSHKYGFFAAIPAGLALVSLAPSRDATIAASIYALTLCGLLGISAMYHRGSWSERARRRMRQLDHSMIFVFIAGTFTPFPMLVLPPDAGNALLTAIWGTALAGLAFKQVWLDAPQWVASVTYVAAGCVILPFGQTVLGHVGVEGTALLAAGGALYVMGAVVFALEWPNPRPAVFGYHEVFHAFVLGGVLLHYVAIAGYAVQIA